MFRQSLVFYAAFAMLAGSVSASLAEIVSMKAVLSGANEVPTNDRSGTGSASLIYDSESRELTWTVDYDGLSGPLIGAHIHGPANTNANAGILLPMDEEKQPITGSSVLTEEQAGHLLNGETYINLHTEAHPGGEIRGQIVR